MTLFVSMQTSDPVLPVLSCDFNGLGWDEPDVVSARVESWELRIGQQVVVNDEDGLKARGVVQRVRWYGATGYADVLVDRSTFQDIS